MWLLVKVMVNVEHGVLIMTQEELWLSKYHDMMYFMETNHRNPSKYAPKERGLYYNWIKHNKKLVDKMEERKRMNQYK